MAQSEQTRVPSNEDENRVLSIEEVLAEEANAILGTDSSTKIEADRIIMGAGAQKKRFSLNADERSGDETKNLEETKEARKKLYHSLNELNRGALCFSGGGIRSATFCLGILQALAACDADRLKKSVKKPDNHNDHKRYSDARTTPEDSLLGHFHYLSTVSGGGYIGSWLSAWRTRRGVRFADILDNLTTRPSGPDFEPPQISWLRAYSNYLTPRLGIASADSWAAVAIVIRNIILNWLIIMPVLCLALLALKTTATISTWIAHGTFPLLSEYIGSWLPHVLVILTLLGGVICLIVSQTFTVYNRPACLPPPPEEHQEQTSSETGSDRQPAGDRTAAAKIPSPPKIKCLLCRREMEGKKCPLCSRPQVDDTCFVVRDLAWAVLSAIGVTIFLTSNCFSDLYESLHTHFPSIAHVVVIGLTSVAGLFIYWTGWVLARPQVFDWGDQIFWALSGMVYGAVLGAGAVLFMHLHPYPANQQYFLCLFVGIILGVPWVLMSQLAAEIVFTGLSSYEPQSDSDREWLGRAAGWLAAFAVLWIVVAFLVFAGGYGVQYAVLQAKNYVAASGGIVGVVSGLATALLGSSSKTPATSSQSDETDYTAFAYNIGLAIAGPVFVAVLIIALSVLLDKVLLDHPLVILLQLDTTAPPAWNPPIAPMPKYEILGWLIIGLVTLLAVSVIASWCVNINRFSLHALYRNRLIRAYLGASRNKRHPNHFTGFDDADNVRMYEVWPKDISPRRLFHVVNIALNVVSTKRLAWQERKAEPFTVTALHSGGAYVGFRKSKDYGDSIHKAHGQGIALGTAMAISGAAVSSNMGYNSSPSLSLLLTLFNVRLGWWLGNPGEAGGKADEKPGEEPYRREGPKWAALPLIFEALGQTTDTRPYVYLSDGGHFENLGLYEMVRRRCRLIVVVDAGCDPDFDFEDLGNAVRKIYIDLGIRVTFDGLSSLKNRPTDEQLEAAGKAGIPYFALGTIEYSKAADGERCKDGDVIYIKPAYHGTTEGAAVRSYAKANKTFPHETTADQWFTESQFESYRALGLDIGHAVLDDKDVGDKLRAFLS
jgi:Patatin-like phospholipase